MNNFTAGLVILFILFFSATNIAFLGQNLANYFSGVKKAAADSCNNCSDSVYPVTYRPDRVKISKFNIDLPVKSVPLINGTWAVNEKVANYAEGTGLIGENNNIAIFGHDHWEVFANIKRLKAGDLIEIGSGDKTAVYKVTSYKVVTPTQVNIFYPTEKPTLTLLTCEGKLSEVRFAVKADLVTLK